MNVDRRRFIQNAPVKNQCSGDYFYGKDLKLEHALQATERAYASALTDVLEPGYRLRHEHCTLLRRFWLLQHMRTEAASRRAVEMSEQMGEAAGVSAAEFRLGIKEAVQNAMRAFVEVINAVDDLKVCLLRNCSEVPLVTSDDPAVLANRWYLHDERARGMSFGLKSAGNLLLLPLSPDVLCLGYDGDVYSVPNNNGWVRVRNNSDIEALNEHQFYNCAANIFVRDAAHAGLVLDTFARIEANRPANRIILTYAVRDRHEADRNVYRVVDRARADDETEGLIHSRTVHPRPTAWPRQLQWHPRASRRGRRAALTGPLVAQCRRSPGE